MILRCLARVLAGLSERLEVMARRSGGGSARHAAFEGVGVVSLRVPMSTRRVRLDHAKEFHQLFSYVAHGGRLVLRASRPRGTRHAAWRLVVVRA